MTDKHTRITQNQLEIWLNMQVTKTYLDCLQWSADQISEVMGNGGYIDMDNADKTMSMGHFALGKKRGLLISAKPISIIMAHEMLEQQKVEE